MRVNVIILIATLLSIVAPAPVRGADAVSLDSCRAMALRGNKELMMARQRTATARYQRHEAFAAYLPAIDFAGGYTYNQRELSIFDSDQLIPTKTFDLATQSYQYNLVKNPMTGEPLKTPDGQYIPETVAILPKEAMTYDIHNVFFGAVTLTQPVFMGGKIVALNRMARAAEEAAGQLVELEEQNVIYAVDAAYWQVVSLRSKERLAQSFVNLLDSLDRNVNLMYEQGVATRSDVLSVDVRLNEARVDLTKVQNGLSLSRMALAQLCGMPLDEDLTLADEDNLEVDPSVAEVPQYSISEVYDRRPDLRALELGLYAARQKTALARSAMLPNLAVVGAYSFSNPNMFNGFSKRFSGMFSVGAMLTVPIWHWGGNYAKMKAAQSEANVLSLRIDDAREKIDLQVTQAAYRANESVNTYKATTANLQKADENLRSAQLSFREGVATTDNVMAAQTAWLKAHSEQIDAMIDLRLCRVYLAKVLGTL